MMPVLFTIGSYNVYSFGLFLAVSFLLSTFVLWKLSSQEFKEDEYMDAYFYSAIAMIISGRIVYIIRNWHEFGFQLLKYILVVETPGLSLIGGIAGGFIFLFFYCRQKKIILYRFLDILTPALSLALVFIKIGQLLGGAVYGSKTDFFLKIKINGREGFYHPTELYESIIFAVTFIILIFLYKRGKQKKWEEGIIVSIFTFILGISVFGLEFLKVHRVYLYGLSFRQILSVLIILLSAVIFGGKFKIQLKILNYFKKEKNEISKKTA